MGRSVWVRELGNYKGGRCQSVRPVRNILKQVLAILINHSSVIPSRTTSYSSRWIVKELFNAWESILSLSKATEYSQGNGGTSRTNILPWASDGLRPLDWEEGITTIVPKFTIPLLLLLRYWYKVLHPDHGANNYFFQGTNSRVGLL